jgi:Leucine-rich repeat (LRR) protein
LGSGTPCLEFLNVEGNCLRELCGLDAAINVREIYAAHNQIEIVYGVQNMKCLKVLDLENNRIARFDQIMSLSANPLELVNLLQNEIVHLPNYRRTLISILPSLKGTDISDPKVFYFVCAIQLLFIPYYTLLEMNICNLFFYHIKY